MIAIKNAVKSYPFGKSVVHALRGISLSLDKGDFVVLAGASGSGKTTLLNILGGLDRVDSGEVSVDGSDLAMMNDSELACYRRKKIGFIFQSFNLLPVLNVYENIAYALFLKKDMDRERNRILEILSSVGIADCKFKKPNELSGGQRQRVAIARALISQPEIIIADEPTANLDSATGGSIMHLMLDLNKRHNTTFIIATHDPSVMKQAEKIIHIQDGQVI